MVRVNNGRESRMIRAIDFEKLLYLECVFRDETFFGEVVAMYIDIATKQEKEDLSRELDRNNGDIVAPHQQRRPYLLYLLKKLP